METALIIPAVTPREKHRKRAGKKEIQRETTEAGEEEEARNTLTVLGSNTFMCIQCTHLHACVQINTLQHLYCAV